MEVIDKHLKAALAKKGVELGKLLPEFYGKITFNFFNGHCSNLNVEQSIKTDEGEKWNKKQ